MTQSNGRHLNQSYNTLQTDLEEKVCGGGENLYDKDFIFWKEAYVRPKPPPQPAILPLMSITCKKCVYSQQGWEYFQYFV